MKALPGAEAGWREWASRNGGCSIALHQAAVSQKRGSEIKIMFAVKDVRAFKVAGRCQRDEEAAGPHLNPASSRPRREHGVHELRLVGVRGPFSGGVWKSSCVSFAEIRECA